jgi:RNA polymerase-binding transcription factor DksA
MDDPEQVRDALKRIEDGTFGRCVVDGGPEDRLRDSMDAGVLAACANREAPRRGRPLALTPSTYFSPVARSTQKEIRRPT